MGPEGGTGERGDTGLKGKEGSPGPPGLVGVWVSVQTQPNIFTFPVLDSQVLMNQIDEFLTSLAVVLDEMLLCI